MSLLNKKKTPVAEKLQIKKTVNTFETEGFFMKITDSGFLIINETKGDQHRINKMLLKHIETVNYESVMQKIGPDFTDLTITLKGNSKIKLRFSPFNSLKDQVQEWILSKIS